MKPTRSCLKREQIFAYSSRMLDHGERARVEAHLSLCPSCREVLARYANLDSVLGEWKPAEPSPWFDARARAHIASGNAPRPWHSLSGFGWKRWTAVAAIAILAVGTSIIAFRRAPRPGAGVSVAKSAAAPVPAPQQMALQASVQKAPASGAARTAPAGRIESTSQEMDLYEHLEVLEDYDMLANFDVLSELPQAGDKTSD